MKETLYSTKKDIHITIVNMGNMAMEWPANSPDCNLAVRLQCASFQNMTSGKEA